MEDETNDQSQETSDFTSELGWLMDNRRVHRDLILNWLATQNNDQSLPQQSSAPSPEVSVGAMENRLSLQAPQSPISPSSWTITETDP
jgi:hypothetical protein